MSDFQSVVVLRGFCTNDRGTKVNAQKGEIIKLSRSRALQLAKLGFVKKYRPPKREDTTDG